MTPNKKGNDNYTLYPDDGGLCYKTQRICLKKSK